MRFSGLSSSRGLTGVSPQMYIALASVHALVLCGLQFVACVRGQWNGKCTPWGARGGSGRREEEGVLWFRRKSASVF